MFKVLPILLPLLFISCGCSCSEMISPVQSEQAKKSLAHGTLPPLKLGKQFQGPAAPAGGYGLKRHPHYPVGPLPGPKRMRVYRVKRWVPGDVDEYRKLVKKLGFQGKKERVFEDGGVQIYMSKGRWTTYRSNNCSLRFVDQEWGVSNKRLRELNKRIDLKAAEKCGIKWLQERKLWPKMPVPKRVSASPLERVLHEGGRLTTAFHYRYAGKVGPKGWSCRGPGFILTFTVNADGSMLKAQFCFPELEEAGWVECIRRDEAAELLNSGKICAVPKELWGGTWYVNWNVYYAEGPGGTYLQPCTAVNVTKGKRVGVFTFPAAKDKYMKDPNKRVELLPVFRK